MATTTAEDLKKMLVEGYDQTYHDGLWSQLARAFGSSTMHDGIGRISGAGGRFPDYAPVKPWGGQDEVGVSKRILNTQFLILSRIMRSDFQPEYPDIDKRMAEVRKQFFLKRSEGDGRIDGQWLNQHVATFLDGDGLGLGVTLVGLKPNPVTKKMRVSAQNIPLLRFAYDRHVRSLSEAKWCFVMHYMRPEEAEAKYGKQAVKDSIVPLMQWGNMEPINVVRIFEGWTTGIGKADPTFFTIAGDIINNPISLVQNPWGAALPVAHYEHLIRPGAQRPTGRIITLQAEEEALNQMDRAMIREASRVGFDIMVEGQINEDDLDAINNGEQGVIAKAIKPLQQGELPYHRIPAPGVQENVLAVADRVERTFNANAGVNDFDRGNLSEQTRTLGENQLLDERSKVQSNWSILQLAKYAVRFVEKVEMVAASGDTDPITLNIFGVQIPINDPGNPVSSIATFCQENTRIVISEDSLLKGDLDQERQANMARYAPFVPFAGTLVDPQWLVEGMLEAAGFDPKEAMGIQGQMAAGQTQPTTPPPNPLEVGSAPAAPA